MTIDKYKGGFPSCTDTADTADMVDMVTVVAIQLQQAVMEWEETSH